MKTSIVRFFLCASAALTLLGGTLHAKNGLWLDNYAKAIAQAKAQNKNILLDFTGSDWCPVCMQMDKDVLDTKEFSAYAAKKLVLVKVDFPQSHPLTREVSDQNDELQKKFDVDGFPSFILLDKNGRVLGRQLGYVEGGPSAFIANIDSPKK